MIAQDKVRIQADPELARFTGVIDGIHFETGSAVIALDSYTVLKDAASVLLAYPAVRVEVAGHTDAEGPSEPNRLLSEQRAQAVVEYLIGEGVPRTRLSAIGYGETRPLRPNDTAEGRALNRRVEFRIIDGGTGAGR